MAMHYRCGNPSKQCELSRTQDIVDDSKWKEHCSEYPSCAAFGEEVSWWVVHNRTIKWSGWAVACLLLVCLLIGVLKPNPLKSNLNAAQKEAANLDQRLMVLAGKPSPKTSNPVADAIQLETRLNRLNTDLRKAIEISSAETVSKLSETIAPMSKQIQNLRNGAGASQKGNGENAMEAQALVSSYEDLEDRTQDLQKEASSTSKTDLIALSETLIDELREGREKAAALAKPVNPSAFPNSMNATISKLTASLEASRLLAAGFLSKAKPPFPEDEATLRILTTSDLAESFVLPLLIARNGGQVTKANGGTWYYQAGASEKTIVRQDNADPFGNLSRKACDLIFTDRDPTSAEKQAFAEAFGGSQLDSRATGEIVALDALTLLVEPESARSEIGPKDLQQSQSYLGGEEGSPERLAAERFGFHITKSTSQLSADAILNEPNAIGLGVYHLEGATIKAKRLAWKAGPEAQALKPSPFTIATEDYRFSFRIAAWNPTNAKPEAISMVRYILSEAGQKVVTAQGYVDLELRPLGGQTDPRILAALGEALGLKSIKGAQRLSTNFRFASGVGRLDLKALGDVERLPVEVAQKYLGAKVVILGFTDSTGPENLHGSLSRQRAETIAAELKKSGLEAATAGMGKQFPVDDNGSEQGKARNRRSEAWVVNP